MRNTATPTQKKDNKFKNIQHIFFRFLKCNMHLDILEYKMSNFKPNKIGQRSETWSPFWCNVATSQQTLRFKCYRVYVHNATDTKDKNKLNLNPNDKILMKKRCWAQWSDGWKDLLCRFSFNHRAKHFLYSPPSPTSHQSGVRSSSLSRRWVKAVTIFKIKLLYRLFSVVKFSALPPEPSWQVCADIYWQFHV